MRFLVDACDGKRLSDWLRKSGHDVLDAWELGHDPGDQALLERAESENRILVTIDTDFGELIFLNEIKHNGLVRLPDVPAAKRIALMAELLERHQQALATGSLITIRNDRIRISVGSVSH